MLKKVILSKFRNFESFDISFSKGITMIVGPNATGKTNILESVFLLATGKSFKAKIEEEMINYDADIARVLGKVDGNDLEIVLTRGEIDVGADRPEKVARKKMMLNKISKRLIDFAGSLRVVLFGPWDLSLVTESPSIRRKFLDTMLSQVDREYRRAILSYEKGLRQRNRLLYRIREEGVARSQLLFWNKLLIKNGDYISQQRNRFIEFVNAGNFQFTDSSFRINYDRSAISETRLEQYSTEEIAAATTLVGPHRDDFVFEIGDWKFEVGNSRELARYGSRGEQRMGVLWLKLAEIAFIEEEIEEKPTLLLDDIFSELDHEHRKIVMNVIENYQTIISTADPHFVESFKEVDRINLTK